MVAASSSLHPPRCMTAVTRRTRPTDGTVFIVGVIGEKAALVDFWFWLGRRAFEKIEVATLIGLGDVLLVQRAVTALVPRCRFLPHGAASRELLVAYFEHQLAFGHIELDEITSAHQREWAAHERLWRNVQHASAV